jgi:hypothetical protein
MEHTLELTDTITIQESLERSGNNMNCVFSETIELSAELTSAYFIRRVGDTAFIRTNYP